MVGSPLGRSTKVGCCVCASTHVEATALVRGVGDVWAQKLSVRKQEQDVPEVP